MGFGSGVSDVPFSVGRGARTLIEEHDALVRRLPGMGFAPAAASIEDDRAALIKRLENGVRERDALLKAERDRHRSELEALKTRLTNAEEREGSMHNDLLLAKQDTVALAAARRRLEDLQRANESNTEKLSALSEAEGLNQQKHGLLLDALESERVRRAQLESDLDVAHAALETARGSLDGARAELGRTRDELQAERARSAHLAAQYEALERQREA